MEKLLKNKKGITLAALVVTVVLLAILASISISGLSGDKGLINQTEYSALMHEIARNRA